MEHSENLGRSVGNALRLPALRLSSAPEACIHCGKCSAACPKSVIRYRWKHPGGSGSFP
ncbi:MAG: 4Fe-4S dicluster domain-containing protein [Spirochaetota bacterium]